MIIVPLENTFGFKDADEQSEIIQELTLHARRAHLAGTVVPVWESGGQMSFIAPRPWHFFFRTLSMFSVVANCNKELYW